MAIFIMLSKLQDDGAETIVKNPNRIKEVDAELSQMGVKVLHQWAVLGPYDFVNVVEAPDVATIARVSTELAARGTMSVMTLAAMPIDAYIDAVKQRGSDESANDKAEQAAEVAAIG